MSEKSVQVLDLEDIQTRANEIRCALNNGPIHSRSSNDRLALRADILMDKINAVLAAAPEPATKAAAMQTPEIRPDKPESSGPSAPAAAPSLPLTREQIDEYGQKPYLKPFVLALCDQALRAIELEAENMRLRSELHRACRQHEGAASKLWDSEQEVARLRGELAAANKLLSGVA